ncbi:MAG TPA: hypothetical protein VE983_12190, partial [Solirubrobacteraceae bacterium]|nr:hypothetical protein [Solirubrobacteraceae bacterium]
MVLHGDGLRIELPAGWEGRCLRPSPHLVALQAADGPIEPEDDELGERTTALLSAGSCFLSVTEYLAGS